ncbi:hypothetical protein [Aliiglaciecola lipolytica]|uniref:Uncharacterized protein n=1 Tax=Aliiglaciecola lipolytica E3 TaxID=1127673 RepID=K6YN26_9ALTE|nr:hypothetical protein [Aliiglaciecola lipolytica]GAC12745.1 hypothetical protein GLIP_0090 [Aliiglaciecola lipolytica E3]
MSENKAPLELLISNIKRHPIVLVLTALGTLLIVLSSVTDASKNLLSLFQSTDRIEINGQWQANVKYSWNEESVTEKFHFYGDAESLAGTASFLQRPRGIVEGTVKGNRVEFKTKTQSIVGSGETNLLVHHYQGVYSHNAIHILMYSQGGNTQGELAEFDLFRASIDEKSD